MKSNHTEVLRLGTRKSLLALAQSGWVAREIERLNPGTRVELVGIETQGDKVLDKPLSKMEGKEFFTAELDHALIRGEVDLTVHSMKDLSLDRPAAIKLAAVPPRELQHDIIVFHESVIDRIKRGEAIRIGTSSPRRLTLIPPFLKNALPRFEGTGEPNLQFIEIRGNVNTRIGRIHESVTSDRKLDGVVLAFAGLERLALDQKASVELKHLLRNTRFMVLPLKLCPTAPAQGALAIEARTDAPETLAKIAKLHHEPTLSLVKKERDVLGEWGGGCHQKLGASAIHSGIMFVQGVKPSGEVVDETRGAPTPLQTTFHKIEASDVFDFRPERLSRDDQMRLERAPSVFIAHSRAYEFLADQTLLQLKSHKRIWVSGSKSWFKLASQGLWIEGSLDGQGIETMTPFLSKLLLGFHGKAPLLLTHRESASDTPGGLGTYSHKFREIPPDLDKIREIYWASGLTFQALWSKLGPDQMLKKKHACGPGKTASLIRETLEPHGVKPTILSME